MGIVPRSYPKAPKPPKPKCQATVEDYVHGTRYNLSRPFTSPKHKQCSRYARLKVGKLCLCALHTKLALEGLVDDDGTVATRGALADVRKYPKKFPEGIYSWARGLKAEELTLTSDTITDEHIHELARRALTAEQHKDCETALQKFDRHATRFERNRRKYARARCADVWNTSDAKETT